MKILRTLRFSRQLRRLLPDCVLLKLCACVKSSQTFTWLFENAATTVLTFTPKQWTPFSRVNGVLVHTNLKLRSGTDESGAGSGSVLLLIWAVTWGSTAGMDLKDFGHPLGCFLPPSNSAVAHCCLGLQVWEIFTCKLLQIITTQQTTRPTGLTT